MELLECRLAIDDLDEFVGTLGEVGDRHGVSIQAFDAAYVADRAHLERAVELADRAIERGENVARDRAVEILLSGAGRRQIDQALEMGVEEGEQAGVVLIAGDPALEGSAEVAAREVLTALPAVRSIEPTLEPVDERTLTAFFEITDAERAATDASLSALVRERVALLAIDR